MHFQVCVTQHNASPSIIPGNYCLPTFKTVHRCTIELSSYKFVCLFVCLFPSQSHHIIIHIGVASSYDVYVSGRLRPRLTPPHRDRSGTALATRPQALGGAGGRVCPAHKLVAPGVDSGPGVEVLLHRPSA